MPRDIGFPRTMLEAALGYAELGLAVFPCRPADKAPLVKRGFYAAATDCSQIEAWWTRWPLAMIGMPTGPVSGVDVLDLDTKHDGFAAVPGWEDLSPLIVRTPSGGAHLYFRASGVRCSSSEIGPGVDTRGEGGYVVVPPSSAAGGKSYTLDKGDFRGLGGLPPFPGYLSSRLAPRGPRRPSGEGGQCEDVDPALVAAALAVIPNLDLGWDEWNRIAMATYAATDGSDAGFEAFAAWSAKSGKDRPRETEKRWRRIGRSPPTSIGFGTLAYLANEADPSWSEDYHEAIEQALAKSASDADHEALLKALGLGGDARVEPEALTQGHDVQPSADVDEPESAAPEPPADVAAAEGPEDAEPEPPADQAKVDPVAPAVATPREPEAPEPKAAEPAPKAAILDPWAEFIVPGFPLDTLPSTLRPFAEGTAKAMGVDAGAAAMATLTAVSGAVSHKNRLRMQATGRWYVRPRLWTALIGPPSSLKTPVIDAAIEPLRVEQGHLQRAYRGLIREYEVAKERGEKPDRPEPPVRYLVNDVTPEKLGEVLARPGQERGVLVATSELSGWIGALDRYGSGKGGASARAFWLQAYDGGPHTVDRIQRGETFIENLSVSVLGGLQPDRLRQLGDLTSDGLLQRFVPVLMAKQDYPEGAASTEDYDWLMSELLAVEPREFDMEAKALAVAEDLRRYLFDLGQALSGPFSAFVGKLPGLHGSLALLLHLAEMGKGPVTVEAVANAARIVREFLIPHGQAFYEAVAGGSEQGDFVRALASYLLTSAPQFRFVPSDFARNVAGLRDANSFELNRKVSILVAGGWLEEELKLRGPPIPKAWHLVPEVRPAMEDRRAREEARKAALRELMEQRFSERGR